MTASTRSGDCARSPGTGGGSRRWGPSYLGHTRSGRSWMPQRMNWRPWRSSCPRRGSFGVRRRRPGVPAVAGMERPRHRAAQDRLRHRWDPVVTCRRSPQGRPRAAAPAAGRRRPPGPVARCRGGRPGWLTTSRTTSTGANSIIRGTCRRSRPRCSWSPAGTTGSCRGSSLTGMRWTTRGTRSG